MREVWRRGAAALAVVLFLAGGAGVWAGDYAGFPTVSVLLDGVPVPSDVPAVLVEGRALLPLRAVARTLGVDVAWEAATQTVSVAALPAGSDALGRQLAETRAAASLARLQLEEARSAVAGLEPQAAAATAALAAAQAQQAVAQQQMEDLQRELAAATTRLAERQAGSSGAARREALQSALMTMPPGSGGAGPGVFQALIGGEAVHRFSFLRTWQLPAAAQERVVLRDPAGAVLDDQTRDLAAGRRSVQGDYRLRLAAAGVYSFEISLDGQPVTTLRLPVIDPQAGLATAHATVLPGDAGVSGDALVALAEAFETAVYPLLAEELGYATAAAPPVIRAFSDRDAWRAAQVAGGLTAAEAATITGTAADYTRGGQVDLLVDATPDPTALRYSLGWQSALLAGRQLAGEAAWEALPFWLRHGLAEYTGLRAEAAGSLPVWAAGRRQARVAPVLALAAHGQPTPLPRTAAEAAATRGNEPDTPGLLAVERMLTQGGPGALRTYLRSLGGGEAHGAALQAATGQGEAAFAAGLAQALRSEATAPNLGFTFTLTVPAGFVGDLIVQVGRTWQMWLMTAVAPGTYVFTVDGAGAVQADHGVLVRQDLRETVSAEEIRVVLRPTFPVHQGDRLVDSGTIYLRSGGGGHWYQGAAVWYQDADRPLVTDQLTGALGVRLTALLRLPGGGDA